MTPRPSGRTIRQVPRPRTRNPCRVSHEYGLASSAFARHYSRNHYCFLFLRVLRCFTSPRSLHAPYVFRCGSPGSSRPWRGFPIRTPWDHSPVIDSPRLIADSYVLLRLLMPRHPPCALKNLTTKDQKIISREPRKPTTHNTTNPPKKGASNHHAQPDPGSYSWKLLLIKDARVHYVVLKQQPQTTHPTQLHARSVQPGNQKQTNPPETPTKAIPAGPVASGPNSVPNTTRQPH